MHLSVIGSGYVGTTIAGCFADLGHSVVNVDIDEEIVESINRGESPIQEPGLNERIAATPGEFLGLKGPSGSGKSTLLHLLAALDVPSAGTVTLQGRDPATLSARERARFRPDKFGMIY